MSSPLSALANSSVSHDQFHLISLFSLGAFVYRVPGSEVINQVRCELYDFLQSQEAVENPNFSLDTKSYATVKLTLSTTGYGDVKFAKIDTKKLGLASILAIGSSSQPFPSLDMKSTGQTVADVTVNVSQNPIPAENNPHPRNRISLTT